MDRRACQEFGASAKVLMERAGLAVFDVVREMLPEGGRIAVFCGRGNNGGDGFVVARLAHLHGFRVDCLVAGEPGQLGPDAEAQAQTARAQGVDPIHPSDPRWKRRLECVGCQDLVVDALLGTGATHPVDGPIREAIRSINRSGVPALSIDVPSGIHCDTGQELGESVWALRTVTMGRPKPFLFQGVGVEHAGHWSVAEIGFPGALLAEPTEARLLDDAWVSDLLPERLRASHKGENGSVLIVAGSADMRGAAVLAAMAAVRSGAGLVTVASVPEVCDAVSHHLPEALLVPLPSVDGAIGLEAVETLVARQNRTSAAVFGPGLGLHPETLECLRAVWSRWSVPAVIDADALNAHALGVPLPRGACVLTPHPGEMGRLLGCPTAEVQRDRFGAARRAVERTGKCIVLKGAYSIAAEPDMPMAVNRTGNCGMATGGMGDVLSGVVATLLAQELPEGPAAAAGMYWHGLAANLCAEEIGPLGYTASEVARMLPKARRRLVSPCAPD